MPPLFSSTTYPFATLTDAYDFTERKTNLASLGLKDATGGVTRTLRDPLVRRGFCFCQQDNNTPPGAERILQRRLRSIGRGALPGSLLELRSPANATAALETCYNSCQPRVLGVGRALFSVAIRQMSGPVIAGDSIDPAVPSGQATLSCVTDLQVLAGMQKTVALPLRHGLSP